MAVSWPPLSRQHDDDDGAFFLLFLTSACACSLKSPRSFVYPSLLSWKEKTTRARNNNAKQI